MQVIVDYSDGGTQVFNIPNPGAVVTGLEIDPVAVGTGLEIDHEESVMVGPRLARPRSWRLTMAAVLSDAGYTLTRYEPGAPRPRRRALRGRRR